MGDFRKVHCAFCRQTFVAASAEQCALCGKRGGVHDVGSPAPALHELIAANQAASPGQFVAPSESSSDAVGSLFGVWGLFKLSLAGVAMIMMGGALMTPP